MAKLNSYLNPEIYIDVDPQEFSVSFEAKKLSFAPILYIEGSGTKKAIVKSVGTPPTNSTFGITKIEIFGENHDPKAMGSKEEFLAAFLKVLVVKALEGTVPLVKPKVYFRNTESLGFLKGFQFDLLNRAARSAGARQVEFLDASKSSQRSIG